MSLLITAVVMGGIFLFIRHSKWFAAFAEKHLNIPSQPAQAKGTGGQEAPSNRKLTPEERAAEWCPSWKRQMADSKMSSKTGCLLIIILFLLLIAFCDRGKSVREGADCLERQEAVRNLGKPDYDGRCR
jgi:hypothetical protein